MKTTSIFKAKVVIDEHNNIQITPYRSNPNVTRYPVMMTTPHGALQSTMSTYRLVISVPKTLGALQAASIMLSEATEAAEYLCQWSLSS